MNEIYINNTLTSALKMIFEFYRVKRVNFNAGKTQCCVLTRKRDRNSTSSVTVYNVNIKKSEALDNLDMKDSAKGISFHLISLLFT